MSAPSATSQAPAVADIAGAVKRQWPRIALRVAVAVMLPTFAALLVRDFGLRETIAGFVPNIGLAALLPFAAPERDVAFLVLVLVLASFTVPKRTAQILFVVTGATILGVGFNHSRLRWAELFVDANYSSGGPGALAWTWGVLMLATVLLFILAEEVLDTRRQQAERAVSADESRDFQRVHETGAALAVAGGGALFGLVLWLGRVVGASFDAQSVFGRLNPVYVMFGLGMMIVLAVVLAARRT